MCIRNSNGHRQRQFTLCMFLKLNIIRETLQNGRVVCEGRNLNYKNGKSKFMR